MARKALCIGINQYPLRAYINTNIDLKGAVNDARRWALLLTKHFDFAKSDVSLILDEQATKAAVLNGLKEMLTGAQAGDRFVYMFSGHGTYLKKEVDGRLGYDQAQCTYDWESNLLVDNELRELFLNLPQGVKLSVISDSCHSGSVTRKGKEEMATPRSFSSSPQTADDPLSPLCGVQMPRHLPPSWIGGEELTELEFAAIKKSAGTTQPLPTLLDMPESDMRDVLLSGCDQLEFSWDAPFKEGHHGALTFYAVHAIRQKDYKITYRELHKQVRQWLVKYKFRQTPQLEGKSENKEQLIFL